VYVTVTVFELICNKHPQNLFFSWFHHEPHLSLLLRSQVLKHSQMFCYIQLHSDFAVDSNFVTWFLYLVLSTLTNIILHQTYCMGTSRDMPCSIMKWSMATPWLHVHWYFWPGLPNPPAVLNDAVECFNSPASYLVHPRFETRIISLTGYIDWKLSCIFSVTVRKFWDSTSK